MKELNDLETATKYILMFRCLKCSNICESIQTRCTQCGCLFVGEATEQDKEEYNHKIERLKELREQKESE